jgi:Family of unknown function (DUF5990)
MLIRIEGFDLPGRTCGPGPDYPNGHHNIHVAVQGRRGQQDLYGPVAADVSSVVWELRGDVASPPPSLDLRGPQIHGGPGRRFIYVTWGVVDDTDVFTMFRRAKLWLNAVSTAVMASAYTHDLLVGRLGLSDDDGWPLCASVRPPRIEWSAGAGGVTGDSRSSR